MNPEQVIEKVKLLSWEPGLRESFRPHWMHYEQFGARMRAIDIVADLAQPRIEVGDARLLPFPSASFDFVTVPICCLAPETRVQHYWRS